MFDEENDHLGSIDWQSIQDQQRWFDKYKINVDDADDELAGLNFEQFRKFLTSSLYSYLDRAISAAKVDRLDAVKFTKDQELTLFKHFDINSDNLLDRDEFGQLCHNWLYKIYRSKSALVIVDVQNDFIDGSLALIKSPAEHDGVEVVPIINKLLDENIFDIVVYTQDWHPSDHIGFHDNLHLRKWASKSPKADNRTADGKVTDETKHQNDSQHNATSAIKTNSISAAFSKLAKLSSKKAKVFDTVLFDDGRMEQILWPRHCVQGSWGAELHPKLKVIQNSIRILKGTLSHVDAYSAFWDNMRLNETNLRDELITRGVTDVFFCGLAYDYCVAASALDSRRANFMTYVIEDACRGINNDSIKKMTSHMIENDILIVDTESTRSLLTSRHNYAQDNIENSQLQDENDNDSRKVHVKLDKLAVKDVGSDRMRSDDIRDMIVSACYKKAFLQETNST